MLSQRERLRLSVTAIGGAGLAKKPVFIGLKTAQLRFLRSSADKT